MSLSKKEKKHIRRHAKTIPIQLLASKLDLDPEVVAEYLKKIGKSQKQIFRQGPGTLEGTAPTLKIAIKENLLSVAFLSFLCLIVYLNSIGNAFVSDDIPSILKNPLLKNPINAFLKSPGFPGNITYLLLSLNYVVGGTRVEIYHLTNILLHTAASTLVFLLIYYLTSRKKIAFFTATIFAVHPLHTEAVSWVSGRQYILYSTFFLLSLIFYHLYSIKTKRTSSYLSSLVFYAISLPVKEFSLALPFVLIVYELSFGKVLKNWKKLAPFFVISFLFVLLSLTRIQTHVAKIQSDYKGGNLLLNPLVQIPAALTSYGGLSLWPARLTFYHEDISLSQTEYAIRAFITLLFLASILFFYHRKSKLVFFFLSFSTLSLLPTLTPLHISWVVAERYFYLGSLGLCFIFALGLDKLEKTLKVKSGSLVVLAVVILALSARTISRNFDWKNEDALWLATVKASPRSSKAHNNMGDYYARRGDLENALKSFKTAFRLRPDYADAYHNYGNTLLRMGKLDESILYFEKALHFNPNLVESYNNLATVYHKKNNSTQAWEMIKRSLKVNPSSPKTHNLIGLIYLEKGDYKKAKQAFVKALQADSAFTPARQNLLILEKQLETKDLAH